MEVEGAASMGPSMSIDGVELESLRARFEADRLQWGRR